MKNLDNALLKKKQVRVKRTIIVVISILLIFIVGLSAALLSNSTEEVRDKTLIYGMWEEQHVPKFAQTRFEVREEAVYVNARIVDTRYEFDGSTLVYRYEGERYKYIVLDENITELERVSPPLHYKSIFYVRGKHIPEEEPVGDSSLAQ